MTKPKGITFIVSFDLYPYEVMFSTESYETVIKAIEFQGHQLNDAERECLVMTGYGSCTMLKSGNIVVRLSDSPDTPEDIAILAHEIFHAVDMMFRFIGLSLTESSSEAYTYAIQFLTKQALQMFWVPGQKPARKKKTRRQTVRH